MTGSSYVKRLIEVDLPIKRISTQARREKDVRHGHISTLHIWWARRPLAACRAVICAALWPDPADPNCPKSFLEIAKECLSSFAGGDIKSLSPESFKRFIKIHKQPELLENPVEIREALLDFIADFASWDNASDARFKDFSERLTREAHKSLNGKSDRPFVIDPFAGGGSIPLEALRVGADATGTDINPIATLLNKVVLEYAPQYGTRLVAAVQEWGSWVNDELKSRMAQYYPAEKGGTPVIYFWARTAKCEGPSCGIEIPMLRSGMLVDKKNRRVWMKPILPVKGNVLEFEIAESMEAERPQRIVKRGSLTCPSCNYTTPAANVRKQFIGRHGGIRDAQLIAVGVLREGRSGKNYRIASKKEAEYALNAQRQIEELTKKNNNDLSPLPNEVLPYLRSIFNIQLLDVNTWGDLFAPRQGLTLITLVSLIREIEQKLPTEDADFKTALMTCLSVAVGRCSDSYTSLCSWIAGAEKPGHTFGRQALPITWDYCEVNPLEGSPRAWSEQVGWIAKVLEHAAGMPRSGKAIPMSATSLEFRDDSADAVITDPPYYDAVPYADLSDFFFVWHHRILWDIQPQLFGESLTPKQGEIVQLAERNKEYRYKTKEYFEDLMQAAMAESRRVLAPGGIGVVVFAHKSTSSWEVQLNAMVKAGWTITGSWPIDTERPGRLRAMNSATLQSSIHLVCRPRENADGSLLIKIGDWRDVLQELPVRIQEWMSRLTAEGVVGADAIFACLGPALEIFSRYSRVEKASGEEVLLKEYLEYVWGAVAKEALNRIFDGVDASGFEPDARLTAMWLWTALTSTTVNENLDDDSSDEPDEDEENEDENISGGKLTGLVLDYDAARKISQGLGIHLEEETSIVQVKGAKARLIPVGERAKALFGKLDEKKTERKKSTKQLNFLEVLSEDLQSDASAVTATLAAPGKTTLDRVHQSMLLFAAGQSDVLKRFLVDDGIGTDQRFWRLAQALSALYPGASNEKRWVDGVLARKKVLKL